MLNMYMKEFGDKMYFLQKVIFGKLDNFSCRVYAYAMIVHTRADQLLPKVWMEQFDTLPSQCRRIARMLYEFG